LKIPSAEPLGALGGGYIEAVNYGAAAGGVKGRPTA